MLSSRPIFLRYCLIDIVVDYNVRRELGERDSVKISIFDQKKILGRLEEYFLGCVTLLPADIKRHLDGGCKHAFLVIM